MKLRMRGDSVRFRLTQGEISGLVAKKKISESVHFSSSNADLLTYSLEACADIALISARFGSQEILVRLPASLVESWVATDQVGIEYLQPTGEGRGLRILIEKDFRCLQPRSDEDESDNFPHPEQAAAY